MGHVLCQRSKHAFGCGAGFHLVSRAQGLWQGFDSAAWVSLIHCPCTQRLTFVAAVIRQKFAEMFAKIQAGQAFLEQVTYQMTKMNYSQQSDLLAGEIGLLKAYLTRNAGFCADQCVQILGGRGITKGELTSVTALLFRILMSASQAPWAVLLRDSSVLRSQFLPFVQILFQGLTFKLRFDALRKLFLSFQVFDQRLRLLKVGGAEEILNDLGVRQAMRKVRQETSWQRSD